MATMLEMAAAFRAPIFIDEAIKNRNYICSLNKSLWTLILGMFHDEIIVEHDGVSLILKSNIKLFHNLVVI